MLSSLLFRLSISPLSHALRNAKGFESQYQRRPVRHLLFMDDLKVFEESKVRLDKTIKKVEGVSRAMEMSFGLPKCAVAHVRQGRVVRREPLRLESSGEMAEVPYGGTYR